MSKKNVENCYTNDVEVCIAYVNVESKVPIENQTGVGALYSNRNKNEITISIKYIQCICQRFCFYIKKFAK